MPLCCQQLESSIISDLVTLSIENTLYVMTNIGRINRHFSGLPLFRCPLQPAVSAYQTPQESVPPVIVHAYSPLSLAVYIWFSALFLNRQDVTTIIYCRNYSITMPSTKAAVSQMPGPNSGSTNCKCSIKKGQVLCQRYLQQLRCNKQQLQCNKQTVTV